jgi:peptide/nickel transport system ATP-binding protein
MLVVAHDLALVEQVADRVAVLYLGRIVEEGERQALLARPLHPYTAALLSAVPVPEPGRARRRIVLAGDPPNPAALPGGCRFHPRCPIARPGCAEVEPPLVESVPGRRVACHFPGELEADPGAESRNFSPRET